MGNAWTFYVSEPESRPDYTKPPTFDPLVGFPTGRKERVMIASEEEMEAARLEVDERDFCAHLLLKFRKCRSENYPYVANCKHEKHEYLTCEFEDYVLRMKEFERERRLKARAHRIASKGGAIEVAE